jgi:hypothetical protein
MDEKAQDTELSRQRERPQTEMMRQRQREFYRMARVLIAASEPTDFACLLMVQMVAWDPEAA